jgi:ribosome-binding protein aMBF1 (putative translation factor)
MPKCNACGGNLGGRYLNVCNTCIKRNGKKASPHSRHPRHKDNKRRYLATSVPNGHPNTKRTKGNVAAHGRGGGGSGGGRLNIHTMQTLLLK